MDPYEVLGIDRQASEDDIKQAYRRLVKQCHPDAGGDSQEFQRIHAAYERILNGDVYGDTYGNDYTDDYTDDSYYDWDHTDRTGHLDWDAARSQYIASHPDEVVLKLTRSQDVRQWLTKWSWPLLITQIASFVAAYAMIFIYYRPKTINIATSLSVAKQWTEYNMFLETFYQWLFAYSIAILVIFVLQHKPVKNRLGITPGPAWTIVSCFVSIFIMATFVMVPSYKYPSAWAAYLLCMVIIGYLMRHRIGLFPSYGAQSGNIDPVLLGMLLNNDPHPPFVSVGALRRAARRYERGVRYGTNSNPT